MKTSVIMKRELMGCIVRQDSKTGMFNANDLHKMANQSREIDGLPNKQMARYFTMDGTRDLINQLCVEENIQLKYVKNAKRGINGGTWVHPYVLVDMAMWYSTKLKIKILKWVWGGLLLSRNESGSSFVEMNKVLTKYFPSEYESPISYMRTANQIANACKVGSGFDKWQTANEDQLKLRDKIQDNVCILADMSPNAGTCVSKSISKAFTHQRKLNDSKL